MSGTEEIQQPKYVDFGDYILFQVRRTQNLIRQTDLMLLVATVVSAIIFLLLGFILLDHWAFSQGLSRPLRWLGFWGITGSILGAIVYYWRTTAGKTVTQLFAARTLEKADPSFENNLLTLVDLESNNAETSELIKNSLEKRAALTLNDLDVEHAVDRKTLLHRLYALLIGTVLIFGYTFLTPKSVTDSIWRILFPWTTTAAPTTTRIFDVEPGDITVTQGSHVEVSAYIDGKIPEAIWLVYSTGDRSVLDERIQLQETDDGLGKYVGLITGENGKGVDQPISYYLLAGDGRTEKYKITVRPAPQTSIREIRITPPGYTNRAERTQQSGSLDAIEGSEINLVAESNMPIKKSWIQLYDTEDPSSRSGQLPLAIENETQISGNWSLRFRDDGTYPRFYRIECETTDKSRDPSPPLHAILIRPDERPEVRMIDPTSDLVRPINVTVPLLIEAFDPDFLLSGLSVQIEKQGKVIASELIDAKNRQSLRTRYPLELKRLPIQPGDEISFWVEARDNREPYPNRRNTSKLRIRITAPVDEQQAKKQEQEDEQKQKEIEQERKQQQDQNTADEPSEEKNSEEQSEQENSEGSEQPMKDASEEGESPEKGNTPGEKSQQKKEGETNQSGDQQKKSEQTGDDKNKKKNSGQGESQDQKQGSDSQKKKTDKPKYSPDGEDDDRVLEKMIKKLREKQEKEKQKPGDQNQEDQKPEGDQPKQPNPNKNSPDDKTMPKEGTNPNEKAPEKPGDSQKQEENSKEKSPEEKNSEKNPGEKMKEKGQGDSPKKNEPSEEGSEKKPGKKKEKMKSGEKEKSSEKDEKGEKAKQDQQGEKGESQTGEMSDEEQKGKTPGDKKSDKPSGETKPGPGDMPDPNGKDSEKEPRKPKPNEKTEGEKKPAKKSGEGEAKPGKGDEKGPTEKEKSNGEKPPTSQNQQPPPPSDEMKKSDQPGESSEQNPEKSSKPSDDSSSSSKKGDKSSQNKSGKSGEKPSSKQGKEGDKSSQKNKQENPKPSESDSNPDEKDKPSGQKNPSEMKPKSGEQTDEKPNQKPSSEKTPEQSKKEGEQNKKQSEKGGDKKGGDKSGKGKGTGKGKGKGGDKPGKEGGKGKGKSAGKPSPGGNKSKGEGISDKMGDAPESDEPGNAKGGQGKQGKPSKAPASEDGEGARNQPSEQSLEDRKKAAELVLKELEDELKRGKVDPELLDELGWDKDNLKQFQQRLADYLRHQKEDGKPNLKEKQFEEMLKNMRLTGKRKSRSGSESGTASPDEFAPVMIPAPPEYREIGQAFKKSLSESKNKKP